MNQDLLHLLLHFPDQEHFEFVLEPVQVFLLELLQDAHFVEICPVEDLAFQFFDSYYKVLTYHLLSLRQTHLVYHTTLHDHRLYIQDGWLVVLPVTYLLLLLLKLFQIHKIDPRLLKIFRYIKCFFKLFIRYRKISKYSR